jgi:hypothetical protein
VRMTRKCLTRHSIQHVARARQVRLGPVCESLTTPYLARSTIPQSEAVSPGHGGLTISFATRGSRVQIPSAPQTSWSGQFSVHPPTRWIYDSVF